MSRCRAPIPTPLHVLMSAFVASALRTAFQIGLAIYLPFIIIDTVVASGRFVERWTDSRR